MEKPPEPSRILIEQINALRREIIEQRRRMDETVRDAEALVTEINRNRSAREQVDETG
jgi:predicted DNA-binding protein (UPF0278 family)